MLCANGLPATLGQHLAFGFDLEKPCFILRVIASAKTARPEIGADSLRVALFENAMRNERSGFEIANYSLKEGRN